jgi:hypothetical protein
MILVSVQYTDNPGVADAIYNGGFGMHFYNLVEAKAFARSESTPLAAASARTTALCRVYDDGVLVEAWENGVDITP